MTVGKEPNQWYAFFYERTRLTVLLILLTIVIGVGGFSGNARQEDPHLTRRFASVFIIWPGASSQRIESQITNVIEDGLELEEIESIESTSSQNFMTMSIQLKESVKGADVDAAWAKVRSEMSRIKALLPIDISDPEIIVNTISAHGLVLSLKNIHNPEDTTLLESYAKEIKRELAAFDGTFNIDLFGLNEPSVVIQPNFGALQQLGISVPSLISWLKEQSVRYSSGSSESSYGVSTFEVKDPLTSASAVGNLPLPPEFQPSGKQHYSTAPLLLSDIAKVQRTYTEPIARQSISQSSPAVLVAIRPFPDQRVDLWTKQVEVSIANWQDRLPSNIELEIIFNQNHYLESRLNGLLFNLFQAISLVTLILILTLGLKSSLMIALTVPLIAMGTIGAMGFVGLPFHQLSVTGLIVALGIMIDNPIVVSDHMTHLRRAGMRLSQAVATTVNDLKVPLLASTLTTCFAFLPIAAGDGATNEFVGGLAIAVVLSVLMSFIFSLTLLPVLVAWMDQVGSRFKSKLWSQGIELSWIYASYRAYLGMVVQKPAVGILIGISLPIIGFATIPLTKTHFFPPVDRDMFQVFIEMPRHYTSDQSKVKVLEVDAFLEKVDFIEGRHWTLGERPPRVFYNMIQPPNSSPYSASGFIYTSGADATRREAPDLQKQLIQAFPGIAVRIFPFNQGPPVQAPIAIEIYGESTQDLIDVAQQIRQRMSQVKGITYSEALITSPEIITEYQLDFEVLRQEGIARSRIPQSLQAHYEAIKVGSVDEFGYEVPIIMDLDGVEFQTQTGAESLPLIDSGNEILSLSDISQPHLIARPGAISHKDGKKYAVVYGYGVPYTLASTIEKSYQAIIEAQPLTIPSGISLDSAGEASESAESLNNFLSTAGLFLVLISMAIILSLGSYSMSAVIFLVMILSMGLAMFGVFLSGEPRGFISIVGSLGLIGLAVNDSIIVTSAMQRQLKHEGYSQSGMVEAIFRASRHIVSTTLTTMAGFLPLILFGEKLWLGLSWAIFGGIAGASVISLSLVPAFFAKFHQVKSVEIADKDVT